MAEDYALGVEDLRVRQSWQPDTREMARLVAEGNRFVLWVPEPERGVDDSIVVAIRHATDDVVCAPGVLTPPPGTSMGWNLLAFASGVLQEELKVRRRR